MHVFLNIGVILISVKPRKTVFKFNYYEATDTKPASSLEIDSDNCIRV